MLVELNGNDIFSFSKESLISAIKACNRDTLRLRVGRVRPTPITADARKEAVRFVKNKVRGKGTSLETRLKRMHGMNVGISSNLGGFVMTSFFACVMGGARVVPNSS